MKRLGLVIAMLGAPAMAFAGPNRTDTTKKDANHTVEVDSFEWSSGQGRLGVMVMGLTPELRGYFGAPQDDGLLVAHVESNSPAAKAGIKVGDVITKVDNKIVQSAGDVIQSLADINGNQKVAVELVRDHKTMTVQPSLGSKNQQL